LINTGSQHKKKARLLLLPVLKYDEAQKYRNLAFFVLEKSTRDKL